MSSEKIKIGISSCLLGQKVRFDGQHKYHWYINEVLGKYFEYIPVCPEVEIGMGTPRKSVRLVGDSEKPHMVEPKTGTDWTQKMRRYSHQKVSKLAGLSGYIFKKGSPSCGAFRTKVYQENAIPLANGQGIFAKSFMEAYPLIPVEEEGRLKDSKLRENFIERVFAYQRLTACLHQRFNRSQWVKFHEQSKYLLLSHSRKHYTILGRLVAEIKSLDPHDFKVQYAREYMNALTVKTTVSKNSDVLFHILGFLKKLITTEQKSDIIEAIDHYRNGTYPLIVPITLLGHYIRINNITYIKDQFYLNPHPTDLSLRNYSSIHLINS